MREYEPHNPFNGNRAKVLKTIKRSTYEKSKDHYSEFVYNTDNWADANEYYTLLTNDKAQGLLILEKKKD